MVNLLLPSTLLHMQLLLHTTISTLSIAFITRNIGYMLGACVSGLTFDRISKWVKVKEMQLIALTVIFALTSASIPWFQSVFLFLATWTLFGIAAGYFEAGWYNLPCLIQ